jgi:hypothetical protein
MVIALLMDDEFTPFVNCVVEIPHILVSVELTCLSIGKIDFCSGIKSQALLYPYHNITEYLLFLCKILTTVAIFDNRLSTNILFWFEIIISHFK